MHLIRHNTGYKYNLCRIIKTDRYNFRNESITDVHVVFMNINENTSQNFGKTAKSAGHLEKRTGTGQSGER